MTTSDRLMEIEAKPVRCDDEEDLELLAIPLIHPPIPNLDSVCLEFFFHELNT